MIRSQVSRSTSQPLLGRLQLAAHPPELPLLPCLGLPQARQLFREIESGILEQRAWGDAPDGPTGASGLAVIITRQLAKGYDHRCPVVDSSAHLTSMESRDTTHRELAVQGRSALCPGVLFRLAEHTSLDRAFDGEVATVLGAHRILTDRVLQYSSLEIQLALVRPWLGTR